MSRHVALRRVRKGASVLLGALLLSLMAVAGMTVVVGGAALLLDDQALWQCERPILHDCIVAGDGRHAVSLLWLQPRTATKGTTHIGGFLLRPGSCDFQPWWAPSDATCITASPADERLFIGTLGGSVYATSTARPENPPTLVLPACGRGLHTLRCSRDGRYLLALGTNGLCAWDLLLHEFAWRRPDVDANCLCVDHDSRWLLCGLATGEIVELDLASGETRRLVAKHEGPVIGLSVSHDGQWLAAISGNGQTALHRWPDGNCAWQSSRQSTYASPARLAVFSPDGKFLVTTARENASVLIKLSLSTGERIGELRGHSTSVTGATFRDDGRLLSWSVDGTVCSWDVATGKLLTHSSLAIGSPAG